jgi:hypothetical protein
VYVNPWMTVREDTTRYADGSSGVYGVIDKPDYALVIPLDGTRVHLVEQFRYPLGMRRWEFPQGTAPHGLRPPESSARKRVSERAPWSNWACSTPRRA